MVRTLALSLAMTFAIAVGAVLADDTADPIAAALRAAGDNRGQLERALASVPADQAEGLKFLIENMPQSDLERLSAEYLLENVDYAYRALAEAPWKDRVPRDVFLNYVLPYASIDEPRDQWRKDFYERFKPLVAEVRDPGKAAVILNQQIFPLLKVKFSTQRRRANAGPYETIETGLASCSGLSILLIDACRAVGVPARFVGTPLWTDGSGNHSWIEVWDGAAWRFTGAAEPAGDELDRGWFIERAAAAQRDSPRHAIYAARFEKSPQVFPSAWSWRQGEIPAVNVTDRYTRRTPRAEGEIVVRIRVLDKPGGRRVAVKVGLVDENDKVVVEDQSRDDRFDPNDHLEAYVARGSKLRLRIETPDGPREHDIDATDDQQLFEFTLAQ